ncbi:TraB/GumN family protein [Nanoarchaeota archaeon]
MTEIPNLKIIGTSHIAKQSLDEIHTAFASFSPDIVAVELDRKRLHALFSKEEQKISLSDIRHIGFKGYVFALVGRFVQKKLGSAVGVAPGSEMKLAVELAHKNKLKIALVDQDIDKTLQRFSQALTWREKFRFIADMFRGLFNKKRAMEELGIKDLDLSQVPDKEVIKKMILHLKRRYPSIYKVLVDERNHVMAKNIVKLLHKEPESKILVIIGAGHEEGLQKLIQKKFHLIDVAPSHK